MAAFVALEWLGQVHKLVTESNYRLYEFNYFWYIFIGAVDYNKVKLSCSIALCGV